MKASLPWSTHASQVSTHAYAVFSNAAERWLLAPDPDQSDQMRGRAWRMGTRTTAATLSFRFSSFSISPQTADGGAWKMFGVAGGGGGAPVSQDSG